MSNEYRYQSHAIAAFWMAVKDGLKESQLKGFLETFSEHEPIEALGVLLEFSFLPEDYRGKVTPTLLNAFFELEPGLSLASPEGTKMVMKYLAQAMHWEDENPELERNMALLEKHGFSWTEECYKTIRGALAVERIQNGFRDTPSMIWIRSFYEARFLAQQLPSAVAHPKLRL